MSVAAKLLDRLDRVKPAGFGRWLARCPAHEDRAPSLSIRELDDGRVLLHDFGGCEVGDVLAAAGLTLADLFPQRLPGHSYPATWAALDPELDGIKRLVGTMPVQELHRIRAELLGKIRSFTQRDCRGHYGGPLNSPVLARHRKELVYIEARLAGACAGQQC